MLRIESGTVIPSAHLRVLDAALKASSPYILLSDVDISTLEAASERVQQAGKHTVVHAEMLAGFRPDKIGLTLLRDRYGVDAVISTSTHVLETARRCGLQTIYRMFLLDSYALRSAIRTLKSARIDAVEVLPGPMAPTVAKAVRAAGGDAHRALLAGGFIRDRRLVDQLVAAGFDGVTSSDQELWRLTPSAQPKEPSGPHGHSTTKDDSGRLS